MNFKNVLEIFELVESQLKTAFAAFDRTINGKIDYD